MSENAKQEGVMGLYKGLSLAIIRHLFYTPIRIIGYENLKGFIFRSEAKNGESLPLATKALVGGGGDSGVIAQIVASPVDLVKLRMQADGRLVSQGLKLKYSRPSFHQNPTIRRNKRTMERCYSKHPESIFSEYGRTSLLRSRKTLCHRKKDLRGKHVTQNIYAHTIASILSGLASTTLSCPADVVKTRMLNQGEKAVYRNSYDCLVKRVRFEGIRSLWKGFFPTWARLGPWQFVFWVSYEKFRQLAGISSF